MFKPESFLSYSVAGLLTILFVAYLYSYKKPALAEPKPEPEPASHISVAINQKGELMIVDRERGTYQVFSDTVGRAIYKLYDRKGVN